MDKLIENMLVKVLIQRKRINQILEQNKYMEQDLIKLQSSEEDKKSEEEK